MQLKACARRVNTAPSRRCFSRTRPGSLVTAAARQADAISLAVSATVALYAYRTVVVHLMLLWHCPAEYVILSRYQHRPLPTQCLSDTSDAYFAFQLFYNNMQSACLYTCLQAFPSEYDTAVRQAQLATQAALADGLQLLEIEFPTSGLMSSQGSY